MKVRISIDKITISHPADIYEIMRRVLQREQKVDRDKEHFWVIAMSQANKILNIELVALGANNRVITRAADVLAVPLQKQAKGVILVHNHPSGSLEPSEKDKDYTNRMIQACRISGVPVLDHVIITEHSYYSFEKSGLLEALEASLKYVPPYEIEEMSYKEGRQEGLEEGELIGEKRGMQQGISLGIEQEKVSIARTMLSDKEPQDKVSRFTGLSKRQLEELAREIGRN